MSQTKNYTVQPYLIFNGRCEEAIEFYRKALGAEVAMLLHFKDAPDPAMRPPGSENKVMHASLSVGDAVILASDGGQCSGQTAFTGFSLSLTAKDVADANRFFTALSDGGKVQMPQAKTFFSPSFGIVIDRFGVSWMVYVRP
ncbi:MAG: VOC family protein [Verrucomicrobiota bacterium]|jgi:PhnB protein